MTLRQADFVDRNNFAFFLNDRGLTGNAVEIGTHRGDFASLFLSNWQGKHLNLIDPYENCPADYHPQLLELEGGGQDRGSDFESAHAKVARYERRFTFYKYRSDAAAAFFDDSSLDFAYIDGDHRMEKVWQDLWTWWYKLKPGGILAGHDFVCPGEVNGGWSAHVQEAVFKFAAHHKLDVWVVIEIKSLPWSFYFEKPK